MRVIIFPVITAVLLYLICALAACGSRNEPDTVSVTDTHAVPLELKNIPEEYKRPADRQGTLTELVYKTWESKTYERKSRSLIKRAIVYLPYGYSEENRYNVVYLMHGGGGNEKTILGSPDNPDIFKNVIDHAVEKREIKPLIIVCPTYNNENPDDSSDYNLSFYTLTANYHNELVNDLIPAVEGTYSAYAEGTSPPEIKRSRDHRAFGGFSMGAVTTWYIFINCLNEFRYFLPMSGALDPEGDDMDEAVSASGYSPEDFFIYAATGTKDFDRRHLADQIEGMLAMPGGNFLSADSEGSGNILFLIKEGYSHNAQAAMEYTYNALLFLWN